MSQRVRVRKQIFDHIRRCETSGLSLREFCQKARISRTKFYCWMKQHRSTSVEDTPADRFLPVVVKEPALEITGQQIVVSCPSGLAITFPAMPGSIGLIRQLITG